MFYYFIDLALCNSYILYLWHCEMHDVDPLPTICFRKKIAEQLVKEYVQFREKNSRGTTDRYSRTSSRSSSPSPSQNSEQSMTRSQTTKESALLIPLQNLFFSHAVEEYNQKQQSDNQEQGKQSKNSAASFGIDSKKSLQEPIYNESENSDSSSNNLP